MKSKTRWIVGLLIGFLLSFLIGRLVWTSWGTVTGWGHVKNSVTQASYGWLVDETSAIRSKDPDVQADFWLNEIDRVMEENPDSAELAMGCALILDSYGTISMYSFPMKRSLVQGYPGMPNIGIDQDALDKVYARFLERTNDRCLELTKRATELEPENKTWWRLRSLLLFPEGIYRENNTVRTEEWQLILVEASKHDADNALYDYLVSYWLWKDNFEYDYDTHDEFDDWTVLVKDRNKMELGLKHFRAGLQKKFLDFGEIGLSSMEPALKKMCVNPVEHPKVITNQLVDLRTSLYFARNKESRYQISLFHRQHGIPEKTIEAFEELRQYDNQQRTIDGVEIRNDVDFLRLFYIDDSLILEEKYPHLLTDAQKKAWQQSRFDNRMNREIRERIEERNKPREDSVEKVSWQILFVLSSASQAFSGSIFAFYGLVLGSIFWLVGLISRKRPQPDATQIGFGLLRHLIVWFSVASLAGCMTYFISTDLDFFDSGAGLTVSYCLLGAIVVAAILAWIRSAITTDRYIRTTSHRTIFNIFWVLILAALIWQFTLILSNQKKFLQQAFQKEPALFVAGLFLLLLVSHYLIKFLSWKSRSAKPKKKGTNLILGFLMVLPISISLTLFAQLFVSLSQWEIGIHRDWFWIDDTLNQIMQNTFLRQIDPIVMFFYWNALYGAQIFLFFVLLFIGSSVFWRRLRLLDIVESSKEPVSAPAFWGPMFRAMGTSLLALGLIGLVSWLVIEPESIHLTENNYHRVMSAVYHPEKSWVKLAAQFDEIKSDDELMKQLHKKAEKNIEERLKVIREKIEKAKKKKSNHNTGDDLEKVREKSAPVDTIDG